MADDEYGDEVVGKKVYVNFQEGNSKDVSNWYEGVIESYDDISGEHLIHYHFDGEKVETDLAAQEELGMLQWKAPKAGAKTSPAKSRASPSKGSTAAAKTQDAAKRPAKRARAAVASAAEEAEDEEGGDAGDAGQDAIMGEAEPPASSRTGRAPRRAAAEKAVKSYAKMLSTGGGSDPDDSDAESIGGSDEEDAASDSDSDSGASGRKRKRSATPRGKAATKKGGAKGKRPSAAASKPAKPVGNKPVGVSFRKPAPKKPAKARRRPPKQESQPFVDPAGLDIEDRGVEWIVEAQCEKLLPLIVDAVNHGEMASLSSRHDSARTIGTTLLLLAAAAYPNRVGA